MADINAHLVAHNLHCEIFKNQDENPERTWVKLKIAELTPKQLDKWTLPRIRKYLLDRFCREDLVSEEVMKIGLSRLRDYAERKRFRI